MDKTRDGQLKIYIALGPLLSIIFILFAIITTSFALEKLEQENRADYGQALQSILDVSHEAVTLWVKQRTSDLKNLAAYPQLPSLIDASSGDINVNDLPSRHLFEDIHSNEGVIGYAVLWQDFTVSRISWAGSRSLSKDALYKFRGNLSKVFKGASVFLPPMTIPFNIQKNNVLETETRAAIIIAVPILQSGGSNNAALLAFYDASKSFTKITQLARIGRTGETYALNADGMQITESRFDSQMEYLGILPRGLSSVLNVRLSDPGGNLLEGFHPEKKPGDLPLTTAAQSVLSGNRGLNLDGFRDYRGVRVLGAWLWDKELNIGLIAKIEEGEVLEHFTQTKTIVGRTLIIILAMAVIFYVVLTMSRKKFEKSLIKAKESAERSDSAKTLFLSSMSHEFRTPLTAIIGFSEQIGSGNLGPLNSVQKDALSRIEASGMHLLGLINNVLEYVRFESGQAEITLEKINLCISIMEAVCEVEQSLENKNTQIKVDVECEDLAVMADRYYLTQILIILLSNAIKHGAPSGEGVAISSRQHGEKLVRISVADSGPGIPVEKIKSMFAPFERMGKEGLNIKGLGIGLALAKKLTEMMGGKIQVDTKMGQGTIFNIDLPSPKTDSVSSSFQSAPVTNIRRRTIKGRTITVLYVEDDPDFIEMVKQMLSENQDLKMISATTGGEGLLKAKTCPPDLILLDIGLPDIDGYEVLRRLKTQPETSSVPVIALTARAMANDVSAGLDAGFSLYLTKPVYSRDLHSAIQKCV